MPRIALRLLAPLTLGLALAGCGTGGSRPKLGAPSTTSTASAGPATTGTTQAPVAKPLSAGTSRYTVTVVVGTPSASANFPCAEANVPGRFNVPFTLTIKNEGTTTAQEAALGLVLNDPQKATTELVGIHLPQGPCVDFTLENNTIPPGQSTTYQGSATNVTRNAELDVNLKVAAGENNPANDFIKVKLVR